MAKYHQVQTPVGQQALKRVRAIARAGGGGGGLQPLQLLGGREGGPAVFAVAGLPRGGGEGTSGLCSCLEGGQAAFAGAGKGFLYDAAGG